MDNKSKDFLILFMKEAEDKGLFESKSYQKQEELIKFINEYAEKHKDNQEVMQWLFNLEVKILEMGEFLRQDYFQLGSIISTLEKEKEETEKEKQK